MIVLRWRAQNAAIRLEPHAREKIARAQACEVSVVLTIPVANKRIGITSARNSCKQIEKYYRCSSHPWRDHHVYDPCQSVEDGACGDQDGLLAHSFHSHCSHSAFCFSSAFCSSSAGHLSESAIVRNVRVARLICLVSHNLNSCHGLWIVSSLFHCPGMGPWPSMPGVYLSSSLRHFSRGPVRLVLKCEVSPSIYNVLTNCNLRTAIQFIYKNLCRIDKYCSFFAGRRDSVALKWSYCSRDFPCFSPQEVPFFTSMRQILPSSFVLTYLTAVSIDRRCNTKFLLTNI